MTIKKSRLAAPLALLAALWMISLWMTACSSQQEDAVSVLHHFRTGNEAYRIEDYRRAVIHFNRALELDDSSPDIQYNLGLAHYRSGNYEAAVTAFMAALKARPTMIDAHYNLALAHDRLFNADAAHTHYNIYRGMVNTRPKREGRAAAMAGGMPTYPAVGKARVGAGGTMVNGSAASRSVAAPRNGAASSAALTARGGPRTNPVNRGRPIPKVRQPGNAAANTGLRAPGLTPAVPRARKAGAAARRTAPPAIRQNTQNPSGDQQKWWIQDRLNRTR